MWLSSRCLPTTESAYSKTCLVVGCSAAAPRTGNDVKRRPVCFSPSPSASAATSQKTIIPGPQGRQKGSIQLSELLHRQVKANRMIPSLIKSAREKNLRSPWLSITHVPQSSPWLIPTPTSQEGGDGKPTKDARLSPSLSCLTKAEGTVLGPFPISS